MSTLKAPFYLSKQQKFYINGIIFLAIFYYLFLYKPIIIPNFTTAIHKPNNRKATDKEIYYSDFLPNLNNKMLHCATSVELGNGDISVFWYSGTREGAKDVTINNSILNLKTKKWSPPKTVIKRHQTSRDLSTYIKKIGNPVVAKDNNNVLHLFYVTVSIGGWAGSNLNYTKSLDNGTTWSKSKRIFASPYINISTLVKCNPILMDDDITFAIPVYHESILKFSELIYFNTITEQLIYKSRISKGRETIQPLLLPDNKSEASVLMRYCGHDKERKVLISKTTDTGLTWSKTKKISLNNPNSAITGCTLNNGTYLLVLNNIQHSRTSLSIAISKNKGISWDVIYIIEDGVKDKTLNTNKFYFAYPYLSKTLNGEFHIFYTWQRLKIKHIYFNQAWLNARIKNLEKSKKKEVIKL